jgi:hypothetical protein
LEQDTYTPRIVYIAGSYPHDVSVDQVRECPRAENAPPLGQWTYTFPSSSSDEDIATVALDGSNLVASCGDPIIIIAEHESLGVKLPKAIREPVDLLVLVDREKNYFSERRFLLLYLEEEDPHITIAAYHTRDAIPEGATILGQVDQVTIPWLPSMAPTKTGFLEADEYY